MLPDIDQLPENHQSGFVAVIGRPNVGKSTLLNRLLGQKIAITSPKPQTTRDKVLGVVTEGDYQLVLLDTPGIHQPTNKLGVYMMSVVEETLADVDVILWLVDVNVPPKPEDRYIAELLAAQNTKSPLSSVVIGLNKVDSFKGGASLLEERMAEYAELLNWLDVDRETSEVAGVPMLTTVSFSALTNENVGGVLTLVRERLPRGPRYFPADQVTDQQVRFLAAEIIREKALMSLQQEVPHSIAVIVDEFTERSEKLTYISATIYVERDSQKGIVLGRNGAKIKAIGQKARPDIEAMIDTKVYLELWVKVWEKWRRREGMLRRLGYTTG
jgi:GTP-binding protein Era